MTNPGTEKLLPENFPQSWIKKKHLNLFSRSSSASFRATDGARTRDPDLGKVVLYQLSHCRILLCSVDRNNKYYTTAP